MKNLQTLDFTAPVETLDFTSLDFTHKFGHLYYDIGASNAVALAMMQMSAEQAQAMVQKPYKPAYWN